MSQSDVNILKKPNPSNNIIPRVRDFTALLTCIKQHLRFSSSACTKDAALDKTSKGVSILGETLLGNDKSSEPCACKYRQQNNPEFQQHFFIWPDPRAGDHVEIKPTSNTRSRTNSHPRLSLKIAPWDIYSLVL